jgi:hypothetical protein
MNNIKLVQECFYTDTNMKPNAVNEHKTSKEIASGKKMYQVCVILELHLLIPEK